MGIDKAKPRFWNGRYLTDEERTKYNYWERVNGSTIFRTQEEQNPYKIRGKEETMQNEPTE